MLYATTRDPWDSFTVHHVLNENRGPDGGLFLPFQRPNITQEMIDSLADRSFGKNVADILNLLFQTQLTSWDVEFSIGRYPVRMEPLRHRILLAETWHNPQWNYQWTVDRLLELLCAPADMPGSWTRIGIGIAVLFGIYGLLKQKDVDTMDISAVSGDFSVPISAWYAREWGLPIGNIICCCNENNHLWDLICHGQLKTNAVSIPTIIPEADETLPVDLERLIFGCGGSEEVDRYLDACRRGESYCPDEEVYNKIQKGLFVSVVSTQRLEMTIPSVYRTHGYLMSPYTALAYSGLLDYRVKTGETGCAVVIADRKASCDKAVVARALGISEEALNRLLQE